MDQKKLKRLIYDKSQKIGDREFFTSRLLSSAFEEKAAAITRRYRSARRIKVHLCWSPDSGMTAFTDNNAITINCANGLCKDAVREPRYKMVLGLFSHELGHILYTDFVAALSYFNYLGKGKWYPEKPVADDPDEKTAISEIEDYLKDPTTGKILVRLFHQLNNAMEDGYIEERILTRYPGTLGHGLNFLRSRHKNEMPTVTMMIENEESGQSHIFFSLEQMILEYVKFGTISYGDTERSDERIQTLYHLLPVLDEFLNEHVGKKRLAITNKVVIALWEYIKSFIDFIKEKQEEQERSKSSAGSGSSGGGGSVDDLLSELTEDNVHGSSEEGTGSASPVADKEEEGTKSKSGTEKARRKTAEEAKSSSAGSSEKKTAKDKKKSSDSESSEKDGMAESASSEISGTKDAGAGKSDPDVSGSADSIMESGVGSIGGEDESLSLEPGDHEAPDGDVFEEVEGDGEEDYDPDYAEEFNSKSASEISSLLEEMAERSVLEDLEKETERDLNRFSDDIKYGPMHTGVNVHVHRETVVPDEKIEAYKECAAPLLAISRKLQKSVKQKIKDIQLGGKQTGLLMGRRIEVRNLHRNDGKVFYKNNLPQDFPRMAIGVLIDESGSMSCHGRDVSARAAAIILYDFCRALDIPVCIYGHSTEYSKGREDVAIYSYAEFDDVDKKDAYRLMGVHARSNNRDAVPLRFVAERLLRRPEDEKILILISDGQPAANSYYGTKPCEELANIKKEYERKHIGFVAAAIGDDKEQIEKIYGDAFLDITDLNTLPLKLTNVIKKHLRV